MALRYPPLLFFQQLRRPLVVSLVVAEHPKVSERPRLTLRVVHGSARLTLARRRVLELRDRSRVEVRPVPRLLAGDLLVVVPQGTLGIAADPVVATVRGGATRLSSGLAFSAGVYAGSVSLDSAGQSLVVPALRQADVPAVGLVPSRPVPLVYRDSDAWDRRFRRLAIGSRVVRMGWFTSLDPALLIATTERGDQIDLLVVPPGTARATARAAMARAADPADTTRAPAILATMPTAWDAPPDDDAPASVWDNEGGHLADARAPRPTGALSTARSR